MMNNLFCLRLYLTAFCLVVISSSACEDKAVEDAQVTGDRHAQRIDITSPLLDQKWSQYLSIREVIPLETSASSSLQGISEVLLIGNRFYVAHYPSATIKVFSREGDFLYDIGKLGKGPGEFLYMMGISYVPEKQLLKVFCSTKIVTFNLDGKFLSEAMMPFYPYRFEAMGLDRYVFYMANNNYVGEITENDNLIVTDRDFNVITKGLPFEGDGPAFRMSGHVCPSSEGVLAHNSFSDNVYEYDVETDELYIKYKLDFAVDREDLPTDHPELLRIRGEEGFLRSPLYEDEKIFSFRYIYQEESHGAVWLREQKVLLNGKSFSPGILSHYLFPPAGQTEDGIPIAAIVPSEYYSNIPNDDPDFLPFLQENYPQLYEVSKDLDGSENPILVLYEIHPEAAANVLNQK